MTSVTNGKNVEHSYGQEWRIEKYNIVVKLNVLFGCAFSSISGNKKKGCPTTVVYVLGAALKILVEKYYFTFIQQEVVKI